LENLGYLDSLKFNWLYLHCPCEYRFIKRGSFSFMLI